MNNKQYILSIYNIIIFIIGELVFLVGIIFVIIYKFDGMTTFEGFVAILSSIIFIPFFLIAITMRVELTNDYFILKCINIVINKIKYSDIVEINTFFLFWRHYTIGYYRKNKLKYNVLLSMKNIYSLFSELQIHNSNVKYDERINKRIERLKNAEKII